MSEALVEKLKKLDILELKINDELELTQMATGDYYLTRGYNRVLLTEADPEDVQAVKDFIASRSTQPVDEDDFIPGDLPDDEDEDLDPFPGDLEDL